MTASETAKIMENSYRASNIAFIDEWSKFAESIEVDLYEIIRAIAIRPTHSNIRYPGVGVGGYCLTKDPIERIMDNNLAGKEIVIFGVSYRPDIGDSRFSPTELLVQQLQHRGAVVVVNDPMVKYWEEMKLRVSDKLPDRMIDGAILAVAHTAYQAPHIFDWLIEYAGAIVDGIGLLSTQQRGALKEKGTRVYTIGKGKT